MGARNQVEFKCGGKSQHFFTSGLQLQVKPAPCFRVLRDSKTPAETRRKKEQRIHEVNKFFGIWGAIWLTSLKNVHALYL